MKINYITALAASLTAGALCLTSCDDDKVFDLNHEEATMISSIAFDYSGELVLPAGMEFPLNVTISPLESAADGIIFKTTDNDVAYISDDNVLHCVGTGICNVSAVPSIGFGPTAKLTVKVLDHVNYAQSLEIVPAQELPEYLYTDDTYQFNAVIAPEDHTYNFVTWSSSDESVFTVDETGKVTFGAPGTATLYAETRFPDKAGVKGSLSLTVSPPVDVESVTITPLTESVCVTRPFDLEVAYFPVYGTKGSVQWSSSDENVAFVNRGHVTPVGFGTCTITATCSNGNETSIEVTVRPGWYIWDASNNFGRWFAGDNATFVYEKDVLRVKMSEMSAGGDWRGDLKLVFQDKNNPAIFHFGEYPVIAIRCTIPPNGRNTLDGVSMDPDINANNPQCNEGRFNTGNPITLADGTKLIYIDMAARTPYSTTDYTKFQLLQFKVADIPAADVPADKMYTVYWIRTFRSVDEMKAFAEAEGDVM